MPETQIYPLDNTTNVELTSEDFTKIQRDYYIYTKNNPDLTTEVKYVYLKGLFTPYII